MHSLADHLEDRGAETELDALPDALRADLDAALAASPAVTGGVTGTYPVTLTLGGETVVTGSLVPGPMDAAVLTLAPGVVAFAAGWLARHVDRPATPPAAAPGSRSGRHRL